MAESEKYLIGKTALVTGSAKRIGKACVEALARARANVVIHYNRSSTEAEALAGSIAKLGVNASIVQADLSEPTQADELMQRVIGFSGPIDILINNASIFPEGTLAECSADDIRANLNVNAIAPFLIARAFAGQNRGGAIVNFLDARMVDYDRKHVPYSLSKQMLFSLTRMMALEFAPLVRVNGVAPGVILPPPGKDESYLEGMEKTNPLARIGSVANVVDAVMFLIQNEFITGQVIFVDGGRHLKGSIYGQ